VRYLLDTCIIEALLKEETGHEKVRARIGAAPRGSLAISALTTVEIWTGVTGAPVLNYGSVGNGSASHLTMELFKEAAGLDIVHVPYPGSPQVNTAILAGQIAAGFVVPATAMPLVQSGRLKALAVTTSVRSAVLPEYPTLAEAGYPEVVSTAWQGIVAPAKTPRPIVERLSRELVAILRSEDVREKMIRLYFQPIGTAPAGLSHLMRSEVERWGKVIRKTGATAD